MQDDTSTVTELKETIRQFVDEREWRQFHTPKDLAVGLSIEAAELLEHFRFRSNEEIEEQLDMDASALLRENMAISARRYPVEKARGRNAKYTEL